MSNLLVQNHLHGLMISCHGCGIMNFTPYKLAQKKYSMFVCNYWFGVTDAGYPKCANCRVMPEDMIEAFEISFAKVLELARNKSVSL